MLNYGQYRHLRHQPVLHDWQRQHLLKYEVAYPYAPALLERDVEYTQIGPASMWSLGMLCLWAQHPKVGQLILSLGLREKPSNSCSPSWVLYALKAKDRKSGVNWIWQLCPTALLAELRQARHRLLPRQRRALAARLVELGPSCPETADLVNFVRSPNKLLRANGLSLLKTYRPEVFKSPSVKFIALWLVHTPRPLEIVAGLDKLTRLSLLTLYLRQHLVGSESTQLLEAIFQGLQPTLNSSDWVSLAGAAVGGLLSEPWMEDFRARILSEARPFISDMLENNASMWLVPIYYRQSVPLTRLLLSWKMLDWDLAQELLFQNDRSRQDLSSAILRLLWVELPQDRQAEMAQRMLTSSLMRHPNLEVVEFLLPQVSPDFKFSTERWPSMCWHALGGKFYLEPAAAAQVMALVRTYIEPALRPRVARQLLLTGYRQAALAL